MWTLRRVGLRWDAISTYELLYTSFYFKILRREVLAGRISFLKQILFSLYYSVTGINENTNCVTYCIEIQNSLFICPPLFRDCVRLQSVSCAERSRGYCIEFLWRHRNCAQQVNSTIDRELKYICQEDLSLLASCVTKKNSNILSTVITI